MFGLKERGNKAVKKLGREERISAYIFLSILGFFSLFPIYILLINSFKNNEEIFYNPLAFPKIISWKNYWDAFTSGGYAIAFKNSFIITTVTIILVVTLSSFGAYALKNKRMPYNKFFQIYFLACTTIPVQLFIIPLYLWFIRLNLLNNYLGVALIYTALYTPFSMLLLLSYFENIPLDIEESAYLDGASKWQIFWHIIVPMSKSALLTIVLLVTVWSWSEFIAAITFLSDGKMHTLVIKFYTLSGRFLHPWGQTFAFGVMMAIPIFITFLALQKYFIKGLTAGAYK